MNDEIIDTVPDISSIVSNSIVVVRDGRIDVPDNCQLDGMDTQLVYDTRCLDDIIHSANDIYNIISSFKEFRVDDDIGSGLDIDSPSIQESDRVQDTFVDRVQDTTHDRVPCITLDSNLKEMAYTQICRIPIKSVQYEKIQIVPLNSALYSRLESFRNTDTDRYDMHHVSKLYRLWRYVYPYRDRLIDSYILVLYPKSYTPVYALRGRDNSIYKYMFMLNSSIDNIVGVCCPDQSDFLTGQNGHYDRSITMMQPRSWLKLLARDRHNIFNQANNVVYIFNIIIRADF